MQDRKIGDPIFLSYIFLSGSISVAESTVNAGEGLGQISQERPMVCGKPEVVRRVMEDIPGHYSSFQLGDQKSTAKGRRGWLIVLKLWVPLPPLRLVILFIHR